jgi:hypothetical protein
MINILKIAQKLDQKGQYKIADKLTKSASILLMAIQTKQDLEDGIRALYNYFDERTLTRLLKQTNILEQNGDISARPFDYNELMNELNNVETTAPTDLPTRSGNNNYNNLEDVKQNILKTIDFIDKMQISISNAHDIQREQLKKINDVQNLQGDVIPDE